MCAGQGRSSVFGMFMPGDCTFHQFELKPKDSRVTGRGVELSDEERILWQMCTVAKARPPAT